MKWKALNYETYEEAIKKYDPNEKWLVFDGNREKFNIAYECIDRHKDRGIAIRVKFSDGKTEAYSFGDLSRFSSKFANMLTESGIRKGDRVALVLEPCFEFYVSFFGSLKAGAAVVICSPLLGSDAIKYRLENSGAKIAIVEEELQNSISSPYLKHIIVKSNLIDILKSEKDSFEYSTTVNDVAVIQYTSGSTGLPKPIIYYHKSLVSLAPVARFAYGIKDEDRFFCTSSVAWGHGIWGGTCAPLIFGVPTATRSGKFEPERILEALEEFKVNNITTSPTACRKLMLNKQFKKYDIRIQKMTYTGEYMDLETFYEVEKIFNVKPHSLYGSTEVGVIIADFAGFRDWKIKPGSLGKAMLGINVAIIDENDNLLPPNTIGYIAVKLRDKWIKVGDLGFMDEEGYFWYKGRSDDIIKSSGYRIGPEEIETILNRHKAVMESAVIGVPHKIKGQTIKAFIKLNPGYEGSEELKKEIQSFVREKLGKHAYPEEIEFVEEIPKTVDGKIKRKELRQLELARRGENLE